MEAIEDIQLSRAVRRKMAKTIRHKETKGVRAYNTMELAASRAAKLSDIEQTRALAGVTVCFDAMRTGTWRAAEWNSLADMLNFAAAMASPFNLLPDHIDKFHKAMDALEAVAKRMQAGKGWTCYADEIKAMETAIEFFGYQLQFVSRGEYFKAIEYARRKQRGMKEAA